MNKMGVYNWINLKNGKRYVGSALLLLDRKAKHRYCLNNDKHENPYFQNAWNSDGENNFSFEILEHVENKEILYEREQYWMDFYKSYEREYGYNICKVAGSNLGIKFTPIWLQRLSDSHKGQIITEEMKIKISLKERGRKVSQETKNKISEALKNRENYKNNRITESKVTEEQVEEIRKRWIEGNVSQVQMAKEYGVKQPTIWKIIHFYTHKGEK